MNGGFSKHKCRLDPISFPPERMKPLRDRALEGRANPKGISYLYVSDNKETALSEVRPWLGSLISLAQFKILRNLTIVHCWTEDRPRRIFFKGIPPEEWDKVVWFDVDRAFSTPVTASDQLAEYVPTQIIAELYKVHGFDGIAYRSAFGRGHNFVLFDIDCVDLINCSLYEVKDISFQFHEAANPYFIKKYHKKSE